MNIVLSVLQIIGWILLIILLVVVAVLLFVLFCPGCYRLEGKFKEENWARLKIQWLIYLVRANIVYKDDQIYGQMNFFWKKKEFSYVLTEDKDDIENESEELTDENQEVDEEFSTAILNEERRVGEKVVGTETRAELQGEAEPWSDNKYETSMESDDVLSEEEKESIVSKIKRIIERIKEVYPRLKKILIDERNRDAVVHLKNELIYLIKILIPKKSKMNAVFSTGSPDTTGQLFGVIACLPVMYYKNWSLLPDFESDEIYFKGEFFAKGRIYAYQIVGIILRIIFDKNCKRLYTMVNRFKTWLKKEDKSQEEK